eukprot:scaffold13929_cov16-Prasinocladus_malaysianus.AAC.2
MGHMLCHWQSTSPLTKISSGYIRWRVASCCLLWNVHVCLPNPKSSNHCNMDEPITRAWRIILRSLYLYTCSE